MTTPNPTVLIAEDDDQFRTLLTRFLQPHVTVLTAPNGEEALATAKEKHPSIVFTDVLMPKKSGVELLQELRNDEITKDIPVIILLATALPADIKAAQSLKADDILPKENVSRQALLDLIAKHVK